MSVLDQAVTWLNDPLNWTNPGGVFDRLVEHLVISAEAVAVGCLIAWPVGVLLGRTARGGRVVEMVSNLTLAIPTLALLVIGLVLFGFHTWPVVLALAIFAIPPLLSNAYTGIRQVDAEVRDAARGVGLSGRQALWRVELPLAVPYLAAGLRTASVQVVATASLAALVGGGTLGDIVNQGFGLTLAAGGGQVLAGGLLIAGLALLVEAVLALAERWVTPKGLRRTRSRADRRAAQAIGV